jgi:hypothetical protein
MVLAGAVVTTLVCGAGTLILLDIPAPAAAPTVTPPAAPAGTVPPGDPVPTVTGRDIPTPAPPAAATSRPAPTATPHPDDSLDGLSEADWARLPPELRAKVKFACEHGYLKGHHCDGV